MTEVQTETVVEPTVDLINHEDNTVRQLMKKVAAEESPLRELFDTIRASSPPSAEEVGRLLRESEDPEIVGRRKAVDDAEAALNAAKAEARNFVLAGFDSMPEDELKAIRQDFSTRNAKVRALLGLVSDVAENLGIQGVAKSVEAYEKSLPSLRGVGNTSGTRTGNTGPRPKIESIEVIKGGKDPKKYDKLSFASVYAKVSTADIYAAWLAEAGKTEWKDITETVTFAVGEVEFTVIPSGDKSDEKDSE